jgi:hypothetical protein
MRFQSQIKPNSDNEPQIRARAYAKEHSLAAKKLLKSQLICPKRLTTLLSYPYDSQQLKPVTKESILQIVHAPDPYAAALRKGDIRERS